MRILIVEDDIRLTKNIGIILKRESYAVDVANNFEEASIKFESPDYDVIIMDWKLPDGSGLELCKQLRKNDIRTPVLILTSNSQLEDKVEGLNSGADDYLTKPFEVKELLARVRALGRRNGSVVKPIISIKDMIIDTNLKQVKRTGKIIDLSPREYALLEYMALRPCQGISRIELLSHVWDENANLFSNTVDVHIRYLRNKIDSGHSHKLIITVKGEGYAICDH